MTDFRPRLQQAESGRGVGNVSAHCPECDAVTSFECSRDGRNLGSHQRKHRNGSTEYAILLRCAGCGRGGFCIIRDELLIYGQGSSIRRPRLVEFHPLPGPRATLPSALPKDLELEFREAEECLTVGAYRGGVALLRSTVEKALRQTGYRNRNHKLANLVECAHKDGVITKPLAERLHAKVRVLAGELLHEDERRSVAPDEALESWHYVQRVLECLYDHREEVLGIVRAAKRIPREDCERAVEPAPMGEPEP